MKKRNLSLLGFVACSIMLLGCTGPRPEQRVPGAGPEIFAVEAILERAPDFNRKIVTLSGCFRQGFELQVIQSCSGAEADKVTDMVWVDDGDLVAAREGLPNARKELWHARPTLSSEQRALYQSLLRNQWSRPIRVIVSGEFQTSPEPMFGHMNSYVHRLVLFQVHQIDR